MAVLSDSMLEVNQVGLLHIYAVAVKAELLEIDEVALMDTWLDILRAVKSGRFLEL